MTNTTATRKQAEAIRQRMQEIRNELPYDADVARARVHQLTDWKHHFRQRPWPILAAAAITGYLLVPSKSRSMLSPESFVRLPAQRASEQDDHPVARKGLLSKFAGALLTMALRIGVTIATRQLSDMLIDRPTPPRDQPNSANRLHELSEFDDCTNAPKH